jgi:hypothetical protein
MSIQPLRRHDGSVVVDDLSIVFRALAAVGAAVLIIFSLVALARIDWSSQWMDAPPVQVGGVWFTPFVAIAFGVAGWLALFAAASSERESKIVIGALLVCAGVGAFIAKSDSDAFVLKDGRNAHRVILQNAHGWLLVAAGGALIIAALAMSWRAERSVGVHRSILDDEVV